MRVFFYGLFMDERFLATKGIEPCEVRIGFVYGYGLRIGLRATLVRRPGSRAYGAMMDIAASEVAELYADESVADYLPETVMGELADGKQAEATCYNLPGGEVTRANNKYAESLLEVASRLGLPESYLDQTRMPRGNRDDG